jgi:hypothetical protein
MCGMLCEGLFTLAQRQPTAAGCLRDSTTREILHISGVALSHVVVLLSKSTV